MPDGAVWVWSLVWGRIALCSWAGHFNHTVPLPTQVYKWVPANLMLGETVWKCKEAIRSIKSDMHWKTHHCNGKRTCLKRISNSFVFLVKICWRGNFCAHNIAGGIKISRYSGCVGASPLSQFDSFSLPMIELWDIFSLDSRAKQQVLFVRQPFNLSSFRAIYIPAIFYGNIRILLSFPYSFPREGS